MHRELRREEHHAASKLAQVGMELWSEYRDDIHESHEAIGALRACFALKSFENSMEFH